MKNRFDPIDSEWCVWVRGDCFFFLFLHFFFFRSVCVSFSIQRGWSHTNCRGKKREPDEKTRKKRNGSHARWTGPCFSWLADQFEKENVDNLKIYTRARAHTHTHSQTQRNNEQHGRPKNFSDRWKKQRKPKIHNEAFRERFLHRPKKTTEWNQIRGLIFLFLVDSIRCKIESFYQQTRVELEFRSCHWKEESKRNGPWRTSWMFTVAICWGKKSKRTAHGNTKKTSKDGQIKMARTTSSKGS